MYCFYGWEKADVRDRNGLTPRDYYDLLSEIWCAETCAPRMRKDYGVPLEDGSFHCFNEVDGCVFDLTSEQFDDRKLDYENCPEQFRETHFANAEKRARYELLKEKLLSRLGLM